MTATIRATVVQFEASADKAANIAAADKIIGAAIESDRPELISLPEMWSCLGGDRATKLAASEVLPPEQTLPRSDIGNDIGTAYHFLSQTARRLGATIHGGSIGERVGDRLFNTSLVFGPDGREIARYRKIHLFDVTTPNGQGYRESSLFGAGDKVVCCEAAGLQIGLSICYDLRFPELYLALRKAGASVIMVPAAFTKETGEVHWETLLRARAIETQCWIIAAGTTGQHRDAKGDPRETYGNSMICDPWGNVHARLDDRPGFATVAIDLAAMHRIRAAMPVLDHRRLS